MRPSPKNQKLIKKPEQQKPSFDFFNSTMNLIEINNLVKKLFTVKGEIETLFEEFKSKTKNFQDFIKGEIKSNFNSFEEKFNQKTSSVFSRLEKELDRISKIEPEKGDPGEKPVAGVDYDIPKNGDNYILTEQDKIDIASKIPPKVVDRVVEKIIIEKPIYNETTKIEKVENPFTFEDFKNFFKGLPKEWLDKLFERYEDRVRSVESKVHMGGGQGSWKQKQLSGTIDGINTTFTFTGDPPAEYSERVFLNYIEQNPFTDYTISGNTITYTIAPDASLSGLPHIIRFM